MTRFTRLTATAQRAVALALVALLCLSFAWLLHAAAPVTSLSHAPRALIAASAATGTPSSTVTAARNVASRQQITTPGDTPTTAPSPTSIVAPTPTDTPTAAPTATSAPTPTPTTAPTPTATTAPTWHTVATYSGSAGQAVAPFTAAQWQVVYTCTPAATAWYIGVAWPNAGAGFNCNQQSSGIIDPCAGVPTPSDCATSQTWNGVAISVTGNPLPSGTNWTAEIQVYS